MNMRIIIVGNYHSPRYGGVEIFTTNLARELAKLGHKVTLICSGGYIHRELNENGVQIKLLRSHDLLGMPITPSLLKEIGKDFDALHATMPSPLNSLLALVWCRLLRKKLVLSVLSFPTRRSVLSFIYNRLMLPLILRGAQQIVVPTRHFALRSTIKAFFTRYARKVRVAPVGIDCSVFYPNPKLGEQTRRAYGLNDHTILFVGVLDRAHWYKGLEYLLTAVKTLKDKGVNVQLAVIGDGDRKQHYAELARSMGLADRVKFLGSMPDPELAKFYNACKCLVLPSVSHTESFGIVLAEAMACGRPVVSSDVGGLTGVVKGFGILVPPRDVNILSNAIYRLLHDEVHFKSVAERCYERARDELSWGKVALKYEELYRDVVECHDYNTGNEMRDNSLNVKGISVITTTWNERDDVRRLIPLIREALRNTPHEVIVVDDDSPDGTFEVAKGLADVAVRKRREGQTKGLTYGMRLAKHPHIVTIDADLENDPKLIPELIKKLSEYDVVVASRESLPRISEKIASLTLGKLLNVRDVFSNFRAYKNEVVRNMELKVGETYGAEFLIEAKRAGYKIGEITCKPLPRRKHPRIGGKVTANLKIMLALIKSLLCYIRFH